jgi:hypothetical protein
MKVATKKMPVSCLTGILVFMGIAKALAGNLGAGADFKSTQNLSPGKLESTAKDNHDKND